MNPLVRMLLCGLVGGSTVLAGGALLHRLGGTFLFAGALASGWRCCSEALRSEAMSVRCRAVQRSMAAKREVVLAVAEDRLTLQQAMARFRQLRSLDDGQDEVLGPYRAGGDDDEAVFGNLLEWTRTVLRGRPALSARVVSRLQEQRRRDLTGS